MIKDGKFLISQSNLRFIDNPDSAGFHIINDGESGELSLNRNSENQCCFIIKLKGETLKTSFTPTLDIMEILGNAGQFSELTLDILIQSTFIEIDLRGGCPKSMQLYRKENSSIQLLNLRFNLVSKDKKYDEKYEDHKKSSNCNCPREIDKLKTLIATKSDSTELARIGFVVNHLIDNFKLQELKLSSSFDERLDQMHNSTKFDNTKCLDEMRKYCDDINEKLRRQQLEILELKKENSILKQQLTNQKPNIPNYSEFENQIHTRISLLETKLLDMELIKAQNNRKDSFDKPEDEKLKDIFPQAEVQENINKFVSSVIISNDNNKQIKNDKIEISTSIIGRRKEMSSEETKKLTLEERNILFEELKSNTSLFTLHLLENELGIAGAKAFANALKLNSKLLIIDLGGNRIGRVGAKLVANALEANFTLKYLNLWDNSIEIAGAEAMANALRVNSSLAYLDLGYNRIFDAGAVAIANALKFNSELSSLSLWGNCIGLVGARAISSLLKTNSSLTSINLWGNIIEKEFQHLMVTLSPKIEIQF